MPHAENHLAGERRARLRLQGLLRHLMKHLAVTAFPEDSSAKNATEQQMPGWKQVLPKHKSHVSRDWDRPSPHQVLPRFEMLGLLPLHNPGNTVPVSHLLASRGHKRCRF